MSPYSQLSFSLNLVLQFLWAFRTCSLGPVVCCRASGRHMYAVIELCNSLYVSRCFSISFLNISQFVWLFLWFGGFCHKDGFCGSVVRVPEYRTRRSGVDSRRYPIISEVVDLEQGPVSQSVGASV
jgi:hypothetical protein